MNPIGEFSLEVRRQFRELFAAVQHPETWPLDATEDGAWIDSNVDALVREFDPKLWEVTQAALQEAGRLGQAALLAPAINNIFAAQRKLYDAAIDAAHAHLSTTRKVGRRLASK